MPYSRKFAKKKKRKIKIKFQKMKVVFWTEYPVVEKSPTATDLKSFFIKSIKNQAF